jgi:hypothetical protein
VSTPRTALIPGYETFIRKIKDAEVNGVFDQLFCDRVSQRQALICLCGVFHMLHHFCNVKLPRRGVAALYKNEIAPEQNPGTAVNIGMEK